MRKLLLKLAYGILRHYKVNPLNANVGAEIVVDNTSYVVTRCRFLHRATCSTALLEARGIRRYTR